MKRKFAVLTVLGALVALAVPASSMGFMYPPGHQYEIVGGATPPTLSTSLGSCPVTKMKGTVPAAPANETEGPFPIALTLGTCSAGTTASLTGEWKLNTWINRAVINNGQVTMRFSSLPGCKLSGPMILSGLWLNGTLAPKKTKSLYHAHGPHPLTWSDDGASCALTGKKEAVNWTQDNGAYSLPNYSTIENLTVATTPVWSGS